LEVNKKRHIFKTISWRIIAILTTITISYIITGSIHIGLGIGAIEFVVKMILYYTHERFWYKYIRFKKIKRGQTLFFNFL